jgi:polyhydroxybutyrate depolymerase
MNNFKGIGMNFVADTANFIVITPQAIVDPLVGSSAWNSGASYLGYTLNATIDDIGFFGAILDTLVDNYNIDETKVFSCGFSMGGFMTNRLGCEMNERIAAIASVAGTIGGGLSCSPGRAVPACHFHGTGDSTVYYEGNLYGSDAEDLATFWATNNNCGGTPTVTTLPDIMMDDLLITHSLYTACDDGAEVELYRVDSAEHVWLTPANDIFYTTEIWKFFMKHSFESVSVEENTPLSFNVYPNPSNGIVQLDLETTNGISYKVVDVLGKELLSRQVTAVLETIDLADLPNGTYFIKVSDEVSGKTTTKKIVLHQ